MGSMIGGSYSPGPRRGIVILSRWGRYRAGRSHVSFVHDSLRVDDGPPGAAVVRGWSEAVVRPGGSTPLSPRMSRPDPRSRRMFDDSLRWVGTRLDGGRRARRRGALPLYLLYPPLFNLFA